MRDSTGFGTTTMGLAEISRARAPRRPGAQPASWRRYDTVGASQWTPQERTAQWHSFLGKLLPQFHTLEVADRSHRFWKNV